MDSPISDAEIFERFSVHADDPRIGSENKEDAIIQQPVKNQNGADEKEFKEQGQQVRNCLLMSIVYSAHLGSTGTMIGASPNLALKGILSV